MVKEGAADAFSAAPSTRRRRHQARVCRSGRGSPARGGPLRAAETCDVFPSNKSKTLKFIDGSLFLGVGLPTKSMEIRLLPNTPSVERKKNKK